jgi:hypothetical protein
MKTRKYDLLLDFGILGFLYLAQNWPLKSKRWQLPWFHYDPLFFRFGSIGVFWFRGPPSELMKASPTRYRRILL